MYITNLNQQPLSIESDSKTNGGYVDRGLLVGNEDIEKCDDHL